MEYDGSRFGREVGGKMQCGNHRMVNKIFLLLLCLYLFIICVSFIVSFVYNSKSSTGNESQANEEDYLEHEYNKRIGALKHTEDELEDRKYIANDQYGTIHHADDDAAANDDDDLPDDIIQQIEDSSTIEAMFIYLKFLVLTLVALIGILVGIKQSVCGIITFMVFLALSNIVFELLGALDVKGLWTGLLRYFRMALAAAIFFAAIMFIQSLKRWRRSSDYYALKQQHELLVNRERESQEKAKTKVRFT